MGRIKQITKDCLTVAMIGDLLKSFDLKLVDIIEGYDREAVSKIGEKVIGIDSEEVKNNLITIANDCYKRIKKKFPKK